DYTLAWITSDPLSLTAAQSMLDEQHAPLAQPQSDLNRYTLGRIVTHNIVIVALSGPGPICAATSATNMRRTFPNLRFGLLVSPAGGVPTPTDAGQIRLGDVVVSKPQLGHTGVVPYDYGKMQVNGFVRTGITPPPPSELLAAADALEMRRACTQTDTVKRHLSRIDSSLREYDYPGLDRDFLFPAACMHPDPEMSCLHAGCDPRLRVGPRVQDHDDWSSEKSRVVVHRGNVGSGHVVPKSGFIRDCLAQMHDVLCFETEAAGVLHVLGVLVICGISSYCDSHRNEGWVGYAAGVAAAYARELCLNIPAVL
ncbi:hypothetical protein ASPCADRAFT_29799, partial [Aspergillus carbonarius ITEM 5010]